MKKNLRNILSIALSCTLLIGALASCGGNGEPSAEKNQNVSGKNKENPATAEGGGEDRAFEAFKTGVLVADVSGEEALAFRDYYENYIAEQYPIEFLYSEQLEDAASERSAIEKFAAQGCKAIISFSGSDRARQIESCEENKLYYAVASGMLDDKQYEEHKDSPYFVAQIGPSMETEYNAGREMGKYFLEQGAEKIALYGAFIPNPMHVYRAAGVLSGLGLSYGGSDDKDAVAGQIFQDQGIKLEKVSGDQAELAAYFQGYGDTTTDELNAAIQAEPDAFISVGMATTFFTQQLNTSAVPFSDIDSFTSGNRKAMEEGELTYLAGKYSSSVGPVIAAVINAVNGHPLRNEDGSALSVSQDYQVASDLESFDRYFKADRGSSPIYDKNLLDQMIGQDTDLETFTKLVHNPA